MHPIAFKLGNLDIHWYGVLVAVAFVAGIWTASKRSPRDGLAPSVIPDLGPWLLVGTIVGARTWFVVTYWRGFFAEGAWTEIFMLRNGGLVFYGGLVGASLATLIYCLVKRLPVWKVADVIAPSIALGYVFGRIGCLMQGCCYGRASDLPWAISYPTDRIAQGHSVHPAPVYDSLLNVGFYLALEWLFRRKKFDGQVFGVYLIGYALIRSFVELFRGDYPAHQYLFGWVTPAHLMSAAIVVAALLLLKLLPRPVPVAPTPARAPVAKSR